MTGERETGGTVTMKVTVKSEIDARQLPTDSAHKNIDLDHLLSDGSDHLYAVTVPVSRTAESDENPLEMAVQAVEVELIRDGIAFESIEAGTPD